MTDPNRRKRRIGAILMTLAVMIALPSSSLAQRRTGAGRDATFSFHLAKDAPADDYVELKDREGRKIHVSRRVLFTSSDILAIRVRNGEHGEYIELSLPPSSADVLTSSVRSSGAGRVALMDGARLAAVVDVDVDSGRQPRFTGGKAADVVRMLKKPAAGRKKAVISVVPRKSTGRPDDLFVFDVFINQAANLRTYQITLDATGGLGGRLDRGGGSIDERRADYVFFGAGQVISAVDDLIGRFGALLIAGSTDVTERKHLGSYSFRASDGALGTFTVTVREGKDSLLVDEKLDDLPYRVEPATVTISAE